MHANPGLDARQSGAGRNGFVANQRLRFSLCHMRGEFQNAKASFRLQGLERMNQVVPNGRLPETMRSITNLSGAVGVGGTSPGFWQSKYRLAMRVQRLRGSRSGFDKVT
jgi:predicted cupin superfamily sugar epimerase